MVKVLNSEGSKMNILVTGVWMTYLPMSQSASDKSV